MTDMTVLVILSAATIIGMLLYATWKNNGLPECLSDCYYIIGLPFTFIFFAASQAVLLPAMEHWASPVTIGMVFALSLVGVAADYKDEDYRFEHISGAVVAALLSTVFVFHTNPAALFCYAAALLGIVDRKRWLLYAELTCFASVWLAVIS